MTFLNIRSKDYVRINEEIEFSEWKDRVRVYNDEICINVNMRYDLMQKPKTIKSLTITKKSFVCYLK